jgi:hypothetical protein
VTGEPAGGAIHPTAMPVILHREDHDRWLTDRYATTCEPAQPFQSQLCGCLAGAQRLEAMGLRQPAGRAARPERASNGSGAAAGVRGNWRCRGTHRLDHDQSARQQLIRRRSREQKLSTLEIRFSTQPGNSTVRRTTSGWRGALNSQPAEPCLLQITIAVRRGPPGKSRLTTAPS